MGSKETLRRRARHKRAKERIRLCGLTLEEMRKKALKVVSPEKAAENKEIRLARERGKQTEQKFFSSFARPDIDLPNWFYGVRKGTHADDMNGIDAFAVIDLGEVPIQIKSSRMGMCTFLQKRPGTDCTILVLRPEMPEYAVVSKTIQFVRIGRDHLRKRLSP